MPRKTQPVVGGEPLMLCASMRPRPDAAENVPFAGPSKAETPLLQ